MASRIAEKKRAQIARALLAWYRANQRDLPWRRTNDPYRILLSEFMLQQTQVDTVIPYYHRFLERFPTVQRLADAPQEAVLKAWEGLGYYARARNLHKAAKDIVDRFNGRVPDAYEDLLSLPGFGPYTTAAVISIAFNRDFAVLDGNVIRVLTRLLNIGEDVTQTRTKKQLWARAEALLASGEAGDYNQGMMELGATVCTPKNPDCPNCPLCGVCAAHTNGDPESLPIKARKKPRPHQTMGAGIVWQKDRVLITRRPEKGLLGGLWEFPAGVQQADESLQNACVRGVREAVGITAHIRNRFRTVKHAFTHFSITIHAFQCNYHSGNPRALNCEDFAWVTREQFNDYAFSRTSRKLADDLQRDIDLFAS